MNKTNTEYTNVINVCRELFSKKTSDYGTAWRILRPSSLTDQLFIKAQRIRTVQVTGENRVGENIEDEFIAIVNYCVMAIIQVCEKDLVDLELPANQAVELYEKYSKIAFELMEKKNHDYGEAWRDMRVSSLTDLILQKILRVKQIEDNNGATIVSEGIDANYYDMMNYAVFCAHSHGNRSTKNNMKRFAKIEGKSLVFNAAFVLVNLTGLSFLVFANLKSSPDSYLLFNFIGLGLMILSIAGIVIFKGRLMISSVARAFVGGLFIVSGLVKANDPIGFSYKMEEYFQDGALAYRIKELFGAPGFSLEFLMDFALVISVIICIAEIVLGVLTIIGGKIKLVSYLLMAMMLFFTFLTWHTANCDPHSEFLDRDTYAMSDPAAKQKLEEVNAQKPGVKTLKIHSQSSSELVIDEMKSPQCVTDCGCFGDALKGSVGRSLTPKESLWKDLILLYFVCWIFAAQWLIRPNTIKENLIYTISSTLLIVFFSWVFGWYFPVFFAVLAILGALWVKRTGGKWLGNYWGSALFVGLISILVVVFVVRYSPIKDYRPYAIGTDLNIKNSDGIEGLYRDVLLYRNSKTGKEKTFDGTSDEYSDSKIWEDKDWEFVKNDTEKIRESVPNTIQDFNPMIRVEDLSDNERKLEFVSAMIVETKVKRIRFTALEDETIKEIELNEFDLDTYPEEEYQILDTIEVVEQGTDDIEIKDALLNEKQVIILVSRDLVEANWSEIDRIKAIADKCEKENVPFVMIANATRDDIDAFRKKHAFNCAIFSNDQIELKIISRSNPALLVLKKGVIEGKYSRRMIPTGERFKEIHLKK